MSAGIKVDDLVMIVGIAPCGCATEIGGKIGTVMSIQKEEISICSRCQTIWPSAIFANFDVDIGTSVHLYRLLKIDPPALPAETQADEGVSA